MKQIIITEEEARAIILELKRAWITMGQQKLIYELIVRIEKELEN